LTVDPDPGYAVKEFFFTYNEKKNDLYAVFPKYPSARKLIIKDIQLPARTTINFLSTGEQLSWQQQGNNIEISLPEYDPSKMKSPYAYVVKIGNYGKFAAKPKLSVSYAKGSLKPLVGVSRTNGTTVRYTIDGTEPTDASSVYSIPFTVDKSAEVKAKAFLPDGIQSSTDSLFVKTYEWKKAVKANPKNKGLSYKAYELSPKLVADLANGKETKSGVANEINTENLSRNENVGLHFEGYIKIEKDAVFSFDLSSDDGSKLWIDDEVVVDSDGIHASDTKTGRAALRKGFHRIRLDYIQAGGNMNLILVMYGEGLSKQAIPSTMLFH